MGWNAGATSILQSFYYLSCWGQCEQAVKNTVFALGDNSSGLSAISKVSLVLFDGSNSHKNIHTFSVYIRGTRRTGSINKQTINVNNKLLNLFLSYAKKGIDVIYAFIKSIYIHICRFMICIHTHDKCTICMYTYVLYTHPLMHAYLQIKCNKQSNKELVWSSCWSLSKQPLGFTLSRESVRPHPVSEDVSFAFFFFFFTWEITHTVLGLFLWNILFAS